MWIGKVFRRGMTCAEVMEVLQTYLDGETDAATARRVAGHLSRCTHCQAESQVYDQIRQSLAARQMDVDPEVLSALRHFGQNLVRDESSY